MSIVNLNDTTPAAPGGHTNVAWQISGDNVSANVPNSVSPLTTKGDIFGHSSVDARIPVGADGTVLTADSGATLGVSYQVPSGSAYVKLATLTATGSASLDFTSFLSSSYGFYVLKFDGLVPSSAGADLWLRMGHGSVDTGNNYAYTGIFMGIGDSITPIGANTIARIDLAHTLSASVAAWGASGEVEFNDLGSARYKTCSEVTNSLVSSDSLYQWETSGVWKSTSTADTLSILMSTGNIATGQATLYGVTK